MAATLIAVTVSSFFITLPPVVSADLVSTSNFARMGPMTGHDAPAQWNQRIAFSEPSILRFRRNKNFLKQWKTSADVVI
jgi:hypothetical protein